MMVVSSTYFTMEFSVSRVAVMGVQSEKERAEHSTLGGFGVEH